jgi:hypothetical protein
MSQNLVSKLVLIFVPLEMVMKNNQSKIDQINKDNKEDGSNRPVPEWREWPAFKYMALKDKMVGEYMVQEQEVRTANCFFEHENMISLVGKQTAFECSFNPWKMGFQADYTMNLTGIFKGPKAA